MERKTRWIATGLAALGVVAAGSGVAAARVGDDDGGDRDDVALTGEELDRASAAALEETGGGEVTDTEADDEESAYEVEVRLDDGTEVDVQLDESFAVVSTENDGPDDPDDDGDDADDADERPAEQQETTTTEAAPGS